MLCMTSTYPRTLMTKGLAWHPPPPKMMNRSFNLDSRSGDLMVSDVRDPGQSGAGRPWPSPVKDRPASQSLLGVQL